MIALVLLARRWVASGSPGSSGWWPDGAAAAQEGQGLVSAQQAASGA